MTGNFHAHSRSHRLATHRLPARGLRDESLEDSANLHGPDVLAREIVEDLEVALEQFKEIADELGE